MTSNAFFPLICGVSFLRGGGDGRVVWRLGWSVPGLRSLFMMITLYSSGGWESWDVAQRPVMPEGMPVLIDDDLRFDDGGVARPSRTPERPGWQSCPPRRRTPIRDLHHKNAGRRGWKRHPPRHIIHPPGNGVNSRGTGAGSSALAYSGQSS
jgi:hypothetical protein